MCGSLFYYYPHDYTKRWAHDSPYFVASKLLTINTPWTRHQTNAISKIIMNEGNAGLELYETYKKDLEQQTECK